jgi:outer membrane receptor protein involved in Fe transport
LYAQAAEGYRVGQNNPAIPPDPVTGAPRGGPYGPDSLWNYELGVKSDWLDSHLRINAAVYYIDWTHIQIDLDTPDHFSYIGNAGRATSKGTEVEIMARPTERWELSSGLSYTDARLAQDAPSLGAVNGSRLPGSPQFQISNVAQYRFQVTPQVSGSLRAEHQYIGKELSDIDNQTATAYGDYSVFNLRLSAHMKDVELVLFGNNLANSHAVESAIDANRLIPLRPRTVGLTLRLNL